jgi:hypothetical protein
MKSRFARILMIFSCLMSGSAAFAVLADRLVVEVDGTAYTQRQVELYTTLKSVLRQSDESQVTIMDEKNWSEGVEEFARDMMLEHEAQRLGSFQPSRKVVLEAEKMIVSTRQKNLAFGTFLERMDASSLSLRRTLASVVRVHSFILSKESFANSKKKTKVSKDWQNEEWFKRLEERSSYRYYANGAKYEVITPRVK